LGGHDIGRTAKGELEIPVTSPKCGVWT
jgi:hypothetical protein